MGALWAGFPESECDAQFQGLGLVQVAFDARQGCDALHGMRCRLVQESVTGAVADVQVADRAVGGYGEADDGPAFLAASLRSSGVVFAFFYRAMDEGE